MKVDCDWPILGKLRLSATALISIDMQVDFVARDGWFDQIGIDLAPAQAAIGPLANLMSCCRSSQVQVIHTRESYRRGGHDISDNVKWRSGRSGLAYGQMGRNGRVLTRGEAGWEIIAELAPLQEEWVVDKPGKSAFWGTDLETGLRSQGFQYLIIAGVTTDVCVQCTARDAADLGYDCIIVSDACAASKTSNHHSYLEMLSTPTGAICPVTTVRDLIGKIEAACV